MVLKWIDELIQAGASFLEPCCSAGVLTGVQFLNDYAGGAPILGAPSRATKRIQAAFLSTVHSLLFTAYILLSTVCVSTDSSGYHCTWMYNKLRAAVERPQ